MSIALCRAAARSTLVDDVKRKIAEGLAALLAQSKAIQEANIKW
jgi:hypothetical protein